MKVNNNAVSGVNILAVNVGNEVSAVVVILVVVGEVNHTLDGFDGIGCGEHIFANFLQRRAADAFANCLVQTAFLKSPSVIVFKAGGYKAAIVGVGEVALGKECDCLAGLVVFHFGNG